MRGLRGVWWLLVVAILLVVAYVQLAKPLVVAVIVQRQVADLLVYVALRRGLKSWTRFDLIAVRLVALPVVFTRLHALFLALRLVVTVVVAYQVGLLVLGVGPPLGVVLVEVVKRRLYQPLNN